MPAAEEPVLDPAIFGAFKDVLDAKTLGEIYREFLLQTQTRLAALPHLRDREELERLAHTLKGTSGMLGAARVAALAAQLEHELAGKPNSYPNSNPDLKPVLELVAQQLADACAELQTALTREQVEL